MLCIDALRLGKIKCRNKLNLPKGLVNILRTESWKITVDQMNRTMILRGNLYGKEAKANLCNDWMYVVWIFRYGNCLEVLIKK